MLPRPPAHFTQAVGGPKGATSTPKTILARANLQGKARVPLMKGHRASVQRVLLAHVKERRTVCAKPLAGATRLPARTSMSATRNRKRVRHKAGKYLAIQSRRSLRASRHDPRARSPCTGGGIDVMPSGVTVRRRAGKFWSGDKGAGRIGCCSGSTGARRRDGPRRRCGRQTGSSFPFAEP